MADYELTTPDPNGPVLRTADQAHIPAAPGNRDWDDYQDWLASGGVPDPYTPPPPVPPTPTIEQIILYDHENRIRAQEGVPPLSLGDFIEKLVP